MLLVVFEFENERLHVLAAVLPLLNCLFSIGVEVLLLVVKKGLGSGLFSKVNLELLFRLFLLCIDLSSMEGFQFLCSQPFLFLFLLLSDRQFLIPDLPKLTEFFLFLVVLCFLLIPPVNLLLSRALDRFLHLLSPPFLFLEQPQRFFLGFGHLFVENLILPVFHVS